jgi:hypothetical protein
VVGFSLRLFTQQKYPINHREGGWVDPKTRLWVMEKGNILDPTGNRIPAIQTTVTRPNSSHYLTV